MWLSYAFGKPLRGHLFAKECFVCFCFETSKGLFNREMGSEATDFIYLVIKIVGEKIQIYLKLLNTLLLYTFSLLNFTPLLFTLNK